MLRYLLILIPRNALNSLKKYTIGLMSGTSLDGVDVALCVIDGGRCELIHTHTYPMDGDLKGEIMAIIGGQKLSLEEIGVLDVRLGRLFGGVVNEFLAHHSISPNEIIAIGSHGQTLWHAPFGDTPMTMQLGDPNTISAMTGITVVADFRRKDVALGGQGAPLVPAFHHFLFSHLSGRIAVVNIGGIANITVLGTPLIGYDSGCGNLLMDGWCAAHRHLPFDKDGAWARAGSVDRGLLGRMMGDPYFALPYPKSTGREYFTLSWLEGHIGGAVIAPVDVQATLLELVARTIADDVRLHESSKLLLCGGGAKNSALVERLQTLLDPCEVTTTQTYGVGVDSLEAMAFAWLANRRLRGEKIPLSSVTGAREDTLLGGIYG